MKVLAGEQLSVEIDLDTHRVVIAIIDANGARHETSLPAVSALDTADAICKGIEILHGTHPVAGHA
jgi:Ethanolamine utilization protein EutJ (predicted chaperonin)